MNTKEMHTDIDEIIRISFPACRDRRSSEYVEGVRAVLSKRLNGIRHKNPYQPGTAQADAFFAGTDEGHRIAQVLEKKQTE
jgi:hypothetical protein